MNLFRCVRAEDRSIAVMAVAGALLLTVSAACSNPPPPPPAAPPAPPVKTDAERAAWYQNCWKLYNEKNWDAFGKCYADNATSDQPDLARLSGRVAITENDKAFATAMPDRRGEVQLVLASGTHLASLAMWGGTHDGPFPPGPDGKSIPATHKKVGLLLGHVADTDAAGTMVVREAVYFDNPTMMAQLGLMKMPARPATLPTSTTTTVVLAKNDETEKRNTDAFRATAEAFGKGDSKAFAAMLADDYVLIDVTQPKDLNKKQALAGMAEYKKGFPDAVLTIATLWAAGDYVVAEGAFTGTNTGDLPSMKIKKTGKKVNVKFFEIIQFENGKAKKDWTIFNGADFASQLGLK